MFKLHGELISKRYRHDPYSAFFVCDPKRRHIHKATVRDRVLHQAVFRVLYRLFDKHFIYDSHSSRSCKGTHAGFERLASALRKVTVNWRRPAYALKCDVRKFFDSIDYVILRELVVRKVQDPDTLWLLDVIFQSFEKKKGKGLPLGNVTSQLFANVYLNELDQFAKHALKARHYFRYCDDFVIVHPDRKFLEDAVGRIRAFLHDRLALDLHPNKVEIRKVRQGIDFLGYVALPHAAVLRTKTGKRIIRKLDEARASLVAGKLPQSTFDGMIASYLGVLSHSKNRRLHAKIAKYRDL